LTTGCPGEYVPSEEAMAKRATIHSVCECQAKLEAELDEHKQVISGWSLDPRRGARERAPAHSIDSASENFQVAWYCQHCNRNTLRSFYDGALIWREVADAAATNSAAPPG